MALTTQGFRVAVTFVDAGNDVTTRRYGVDSANVLTYAALLTAAADLVAKLALITQSKIKGYVLEEVFAEDALILPGTGVEVEKQALLTGPLDNRPTISGTLTIPAPVDGIFVGAPGSGDNYNVVDIADTDLQNFLLKFSGAAAQFTLSDGEHFNSSTQMKGRRITRGSRSG